MNPTNLDRQQIIAILFTLLMVVSGVSYAITLV